jgi:hypothetical protein
MKFNLGLEMKKNNSKIIKTSFFIFIGFLPLQLLAVNPDYYERGEEYKDYPSWVKSPYDVAFYVMTNYDELSKKEGYIKPLPIIPDEEIEKIRNAKTIDNKPSK